MAGPGLGGPGARGGLWACGGGRSGDEGAEGQLADCHC